MKINIQKIKQGLSLSVLLAASIQVNAQCPVPSSVTASPSVYCSPGGTTNLNATAVGSSINWFTVGVGGVPIGSSPSGSNFNTNAAVTTTYYAESFEVTTTTLNYTGGVQNFTVPAGVTSISVDVRGARGGYSYPGPNNVLPGYGGKVTGTVSVTPGQVLEVRVGGVGGDASGLAGGTAGYNGGGIGFIAWTDYAGGGGGGGSDIRVSPYALTDRIAVAGGGGGAGYDCDDDNGGNGGGLTGADGIRCGGIDGTGTGGSQVAGGNAILYPGYCAGTNGTLGIGGDAGTCDNAGGGGGGGYYGGGGGAWGGGGGGSSYLVNGTHTQGSQTTDGQVILTYNSCVSVARTPVIVTINQAPTITVNSGSICSGNSFTITPSGANTYTIQGGNAIVSPTTNATYTVVGTSSAGCVSQTYATAGVTVNALPLPTITVNSGSVCSGQSFTMNPSGAASYTFQGGSAIVSPTTNSSYTVIGTNSVGCVSQTFATANITITAAPNVSVTGATTICAGNSFTLTANGANTYSWNTGALTASVAATPSSTTNYTVTGTNTVTGCFAKTTITVVVDPCTGTASSIMTNSGLLVYPNPSSGEFTVELNNGLIKNITVKDISGKTVFNVSTSKDKANVNITNLSNGIYFITIQSDNFNEVIKMIKQ